MTETSGKLKSNPNKPNNLIYFMKMIKYFSGGRGEKNSASYNPPPLGNP